MLDWHYIDNLHRYKKGVDSEINKEKVGKNRGSIQSSIQSI